MAPELVDFRYLELLCTNLVGYEYKIFFVENYYGVTLSVSLWGFRMVINMEIFHLEDGNHGVCFVVLSRSETFLIYFSEINIPALIQS